MTLTPPTRYVALTIVRQWLNFLSVLEYMKNVCHRQDSTSDGSEKGLIRMSNTLWEINEQIDALTEQLVDEETGEINEEVMEQLEQLAIDRDEKIEACGIVMKQLASEVDAINTEIKALKARANAKANRYDRIAEYVKQTLKGEKFETPKVAFSYRKSQSVDVVNESIVPDEWCKFETTRKQMKSDIKKALKNGENVPGCILVESTNLQIK